MVTGIVNRITRAGLIADTLADALEWLLPHHCVLCGAACGTRMSICEGCRQDLPRLENGCDRCATPLPSRAAGMRCGHCLKQPPAYDHIHVLWHYRPPVDRLITQLKFHNRLLNARLLGELLAQSFSDLERVRPEALIPVPLHPERIRQRGFNQALELARPLARAWELPLEIEAIKRIRPTPSQLALPAKERRKNVRDAFACEQLPWRHVALVDDVVTTGATVNELAKLLKANGVEKVEVYALARAG